MFNKFSGVLSNRCKIFVAMLFHMVFLSNALYAKLECVTKFIHDENTIVTHVAFSPCGELVLTVCVNIRTGEGEALLWDEKGTLLQTFTYEKAVTSVAFSPNGRFLAMASRDGVVNVWDIEQGKAVASLRHYCKVNAIAFAPDKDLIVTGGSDGKIKFWNFRDCVLEKSLVFDSKIKSVAFSPDGKFMASSIEGNSIEMWNVQDYTLQPTSNVRGLRDSFNIVFSPDGKFLCSCNGKTRSAMLVDIEEWNVHSQFEFRDLVGQWRRDWFFDNLDGEDYLGGGTIDPNPTPPCITEISFSGDGKKLLTLDTEQGQMAVWAIGEQYKEKSLLYKDWGWDRYGNSNVTCAVISPNGNYVLTGFRSNIATLWKINW
jgi:WD40 repeat protein